MSYSSEVLADSPLVYWRLGEVNGATTAADASGNGHAGTYNYGSAPFASLVLGTAGLLVGDSDTAATFASNTGFSFVSIAHAAWMDVSAFTLECIIKTSQTGFVALWDRDPGTGQRPFQLRLNSGKFEFVRICNAAGAISVVTATGATTVNNNAAHHLACTYDGSTIKLYVDGVLDNGTGTAASGGITLTATDDLRFAYSPGGGITYTNGIGDELAYYGSALSATRIAAHYTAATTVSSITVSGEAFASTLTALDGSALTAISVAGEVFTSTATALDGVVVGTTIAGEAFGSTATMLDGLVAGVGVTIAGEAFSVAVLAPDGGVLVVTDTSNSMNGRRRDGRGLATVTRPAAAPPAGVTFDKRYDKALAYPTPTMVDGRPT